MGNNEEPTANNQLVTFLSIFTVLIFIGGAYYVSSQDVSQMQSVILKIGPYGFFFSIGIFAVLGATPIPSEPLTIFLSTIYGPLLATFATAIGNLLSALVEYFLGEKLGSLSNFSQWREKLPLGLGRFPVESPVFLLGARMVPGYGSKFVSLVGGAYQVPIGRYIWTTLLATSIGAAATAFAGYSVLTLLSRVL